MTVECIFYSDAEYRVSPFGIWPYHPSHYQSHRDVHFKLHDIILFAVNAEFQL